MASEYQKTQIVDRSAEEVFSWVSDVSNLPHYLPPVKEAWIEGPAEAGKHGEKVRMRVEIPDRYETEGEESSEGRNPLEESLSAALESIRRQLEEGSGKVEPPPTTH
jgi:hypothetical protein